MEARTKSRLRGLGDLAIAIAILLVLGPAGGEVWRSAGARSDLRIVAGEARQLYHAFDLFYEANLAYPSAVAHPPFALDTFEPLRKRGYYRGQVSGRLAGQRADAYDSPDDRGLNQEFWLELTLASDPSVRFLVARSDDAPLGAGRWYEGAFILRDGRLEAL
jgi:hypothetical protein